MDLILFLAVWRVFFLSLSQSLDPCDVERDKNKAASVHNLSKIGILPAIRIFS